MIVQLLCRHLRCYLNSCEGNLFPNLLMVKISICIHIPLRWQCLMLMNLEYLGTHGSSKSFGSLPEGRADIKCSVYSKVNRTRVILLNLVIH
jgi:hypothetical protein